MDIASVGSSQLLITQAVSGSKTKEVEAGQDEGATTRTVFGDTVEISEAGQALAVQEADESESADLETGTGSSGGASTVTAAGGTSGSASSDNEGEVEELEQQISELQKEISALTSKAMTDESAKSALAAKRAEMSGLQAKLVQLESQG